MSERIILSEVILSEPPPTIEKQAGSDTFYQFVGRFAIVTGIGIGLTHGIQATLSSIEGVRINAVADVYSAQNDPQAETWREAAEQTRDERNDSLFRTLVSVGCIGSGIRLTYITRKKEQPND